MTLPETVARLIENEQQAQEFVKLSPQGIFVTESGATYGISDPAKLAEFNLQRGVGNERLNEMVAKEREVVLHFSDPIDDDA